VSGPVRIEREVEIAVIAIENPPVNALSHPVRQALLEAIGQLDADVSVQAIVGNRMLYAYLQGARYWTPAPLLERLAAEGRTIRECVNPDAGDRHLG
jgi:hypothetical protein